MVKMQHMYDIYQKARRIFFKNPSDWEKKKKKILLVQLTWASAK